MLVGGVRTYAKSYLNFSPYELSENTFYKEMLPCLILIIETAFSFSCQFLLTKLSLVNITFLYNNHEKTLIFKGIFSFHKKDIVWSILSKSRSA
jgi:hypothetical protein